MSMNLGDRVVVVNSHWGRRIDGIVEITAVTVTRVTANGVKWNRENGAEYGNKYSETKIYPCTPELEAEYLAQQEKDLLIVFLNNKLANWRRLPAEDIRKIANVLGWKP
jgi:hypothetical protein